MKLLRDAAITLCFTPARRKLSATMATKKLNITREYRIGLGILAFVALYPRLLVAVLGEANPWTSYFYLYGFGLGFFLVGLWLILKSGACRPGRGHDGFWLAVLILGFLFFATLHALWIVAALKIPFRGEM